jgi:hypothetical protein
VCGGMLSTCSGLVRESREAEGRTVSRPFVACSSRRGRLGRGAGAMGPELAPRGPRGAWPGGELGGERAAPRAGAGTAQPASLGQPAGGRWAVPARCVLASR